MKKLSKEEIGKLGIYEFQAYIGAMTSPTFGGWKGTDRLIELLNLDGMKKPKILEVGCSAGYITRYVAQRFECEIIGIDLGEFILEIAREEIQKLNLPNVTFQTGNVENLPFPDNSFDIVIGEAITALVPDPIKVLKEYKRVLKPNGKVATLDLFMKESLSGEFVNEISNIMSIVIGTQIRIKTFQEWEYIFAESGFNDIRIDDYYDDLFKRSYSSTKLVKIMFKMLYHMIVNKEMRKKISPTLKFARKFQKTLKGGHFGYLIFLGTN
ncbi:MAG: class I SAM-dependent methyltransferase [Promethearchaeota archaeon]|jgi:ubiquinone/menaquinone biosynthesis C-methylase UbiE